MTELATPSTASTEPAISPAHAQAKYQIRFDWAADGATAVASDADIVIWVDVLPPATAPGAPPAAAPTLDALPPLPDAASVILGGLTTASAVAAWVLAEQVRLGRRAMVSIVAAGGTTTSGAVRFAVEDQLAAGAIVDALAGVGIDYSSPEAAAACAAFTGLRGAVAHLLTASASGQEHVAAGRTPADIAPLGRLDSETAVTVLRGRPAAE
ncbi:hypothetical protein ASE16_10565 [Leifsonia sp. Root227]|uniref:2-phosphosulfolactate phosphatase n=1 Tax=Leifsonia sp. Root227 TaxID=1736496 RepID=UPI0006F2C2F9|nr:2-phosphosulfolactate phosphatase [Leifsonia sp. Root227]KRC49210.1 hypothetical protein ASE16_10565 [Leifsonia sp. Root227]